MVQKRYDALSVKQNRLEQVIAAYARGTVESLTARPRRRENRKRKPLWTFHHFLINQ